MLAVPSLLARACRSVAGHSAVMAQERKPEVLAARRSSTKSVGDDNRHFLEYVDVGCGRERNIDFKALLKKPLLLYFSASWCPSCRQLTPKLKQFYDGVAAESGLTVGWISRDRSESDQLDYYAKELPADWLYVKYGDDAKEINAFLKLYAIKTIPALRLVDIDGNVVDDGARAKVEASYDNPKSAKSVVDEWKRMLNL